MFGYIIVNKAEMKFKEFDAYHSFYCGICRDLKRKYGALGQLSLSYDMTFLAILLTGLYEPETREGSCKCVAHPFESHPTRNNIFTEYAADMNALFAYYKCSDLCDAYEDVEKDIKKGSFNPLKRRFESPDFEEECKTILTMMMSECCREFERLPILENVEILRNILYSGVWCRYEAVHEKIMREQETFGVKKEN